VPHFVPHHPERASIGGRTRRRSPMRDGLVSRLDEYLDLAHLAPLQDD
jgi:hypothetical protein